METFISFIAICTIVGGAIWTGICLWFPFYCASRVLKWGGARLQGDDSVSLFPTVSIPQTPRYYERDAYGNTYPVVDTNTSTLDEILEDSRSGDPVKNRRVTHPEGWEPYPGERNSAEKPYLRLVK